MVNVLDITEFRNEVRGFALVTNVWSSPEEDVVYLKPRPDTDFPFPNGQPLLIRKPSQNMVTILTAALMNRRKVEIILEKGQVTDVIGYSEE
jgi:hypothetical protein